jgi:dynactin 6
MSTRARAAAASLPKPPVHLDPQSVISDSATLFGTHLITVGANAVVHPRATINSTHAPVTIGAGCIINERCNVGLQEEPDSYLSDLHVELEANVTLEPGATAEASRVGEGSVIEAGARLGTGAVLGKVSRLDVRYRGVNDVELPSHTTL